LALTEIGESLVDYMLDWVTEIPGEAILGHLAKKSRGPLGPQWRRLAPTSAVPADLNPPQVERNGLR
jgi:hypothetical protein